MLKKSYLCFCMLLLCMSLSLADALLARNAQASTQNAGEQTISMDFKGVELADLVQTISELTGKNFIYDESIKGKVTIISPRPVSLDEAYQLFLSVLSVKDYTIVPSGKVNKIVSTRTAKENNLPLALEKKEGEQFITRLVPLQYVDADLIAQTVLSPLLPKTSNMVAYPPSNTLVITDNAANIERLVQIIRKLDVPTSLDLMEVISLEYASAEEVAQICTQVLSEGRLATKTRRSKTAGAEASKIIPFSRTNKLVVMASTDDLETVRELVRELDQKPSQERSHINVYYLENADAETLAKTLNEILTGIKAKAKLDAAAKAGQVPPAADNVTITADKPTNSLIINATPEDYETLKGIIRKLDVKRKQVFVEALILELSMDATKDLGVSMQGVVTTGDESAVFGSTNGLAPTGPTTDVLSTAVNGILAGGIFNLIDIEGPDGESLRIPAFSALIGLSKTSGDIDIISAPRLLTSDNEEAEIVVGSNVPIITSRLTDTGSTALAQSVSVERKDVALTLRITPQITEGDLVRLNVYQEITDLASENVGEVDDVGPTLTKRLLRNTVLAENGKTIVLGGLIGNNTEENITKVPILGDLPLLGWLFKRKTFTEEKTNLLIFMTPRIIKDGKDMAEVTRISKQAMDQFQSEGKLPEINLKRENPVVNVPFSETIQEPEQ